MPDDGAQTAHACRNDGGAARLGLESDEAERLGVGRDEADVGCLVVTGQLGNDRLGQDIAGVAVKCGTIDHDGCNYGSDACKSPSRNRTKQLANLEKHHA